MYVILNYPNFSNRNRTKIEVALGLHVARENSREREQHSRINLSVLFRFLNFELILVANLI